MTVRQCTGIHGRCQVWYLSFVRKSSRTRIWKVPRLTDNLTKLNMHPWTLQGCMQIQYFKTCITRPAPDHPWIPTLEGTWFVINWSEVWLLIAQPLLGPETGDFPLASLEFQAIIHILPTSINQMPVKNPRKAKVQPKSPTRGVRSKRQRRMLCSSETPEIGDQGNNRDVHQTQSIDLDTNDTTRSLNWALIVASVAEQPYPSQIQQYKEWRSAYPSLSKQISIDALEN